MTASGWPFCVSQMTLGCSFAICATRLLCVWRGAGPKVLQSIERRESLSVPCGKPGADVPLPQLQSVFAMDTHRSRGLGTLSGNGISARITFRCLDFYEQGGFRRRWTSPTRNIAFVAALEIIHVGCSSTECSRTRGVHLRQPRSH